MQPDTEQATTGSRRGDDQVDAAIGKLGRGPSAWGPIAVAVGSIVGLFVVWQLYVVIFHVNATVLPSPSGIVSSFHQYISSGDIWPDLRSTAEEFGYGFLIACVAGIIVGILTGWYRRLGYLFAPFAAFFLSVPVISLVSLIIIWTGFGLEPKIIIVALSSFFPIEVNTAVGVRNLDKRLLRLERSYCASDLQIFRTLALPSAVPYTLAGMRVGIGHAIAATYIAELGASANFGVGHMMVIAGDELATARVFVGFVIFGVGGIIVTLLIGLLQKRLSHQAA
jgi:ABC-type nitrate/sulfonate/bicarbonate transport system permease component